jgi:hypothetical protein
LQARAPGDFLRRREEDRWTSHPSGGVHGALDARPYEEESDRRAVIGREMGQVIQMGFCWSSLRGKRAGPFTSFMFGPSVETQGDQSDGGKIKIKQRRDNRERNGEIGNVLQNSFKT